MGNSLPPIQSTCTSSSSFLQLCWLSPSPEEVDMGAPADTSVDVVVGYLADTAVVEDIQEDQVDTAVDMGLEDLVDSAVEDIQEVQVDTAAVEDIQGGQVDSGAVEDIQEDQVDTAGVEDILVAPVDTAVSAMVTAGENNT